VHIGKSSVALKPLVGTPFGAVHKVDNNALVPEHKTIEEVLGACREPPLRRFPAAAPSVLALL
jgi:hypothetical protein